MQQWARLSRWSGSYRVRSAWRQARDLPTAGDVHRLLDAVSDHIDFPVQLRPFNDLRRFEGRILNTHLSGCTLYFSDRLCIYADEQTTPAHHRHIVLHEVAHILLQHIGPKAAAVPRSRMEAVFDGDEDISAELTWLPRDGYQSREEREAETLATRLACGHDLLAPSPLLTTAAHTRATELLRPARRSA
ncbi:hypothetical protein [Kineococcus sp. SYSU DK006]|uniref:hypothetical protein n=1 Tax=Kineococcus sp. SYSU DK006 TaxID=3383127 RepID=UPI003D7EA676